MVNELIALAAGVAAGWLARGLHAEKKSSGTTRGTPPPEESAAAGAHGNTPGRDYGPLQVTDYGKGIAARLDAEVWAREKAGELQNAVEGKEPFEIDQAARKVAEGDLGEVFERRIAEVAYETGSDRKRISPILAVMLRNELLARSGAGKKSAVGDTHDGHGGIQTG